MLSLSLKTGACLEGEEGGVSPSEILSRSIADTVLVSGQVLVVGVGGGCRGLGCRCGDVY